MIDKFVTPSFKIGDTKITDWITSQKPIYRRHPINLNNNITDISQKKKICLKALTIQISIAYLCDTTTMLWNCLFGSHVTFHKRQFHTRCTQNLLNDTQHSHFISQSCLLKGKTHNASEFKANKTTIILSKISSAYECNKNHRTPSPIWARSNFLNMNGQITR